MLVRAYQSTLNHASARAPPPSAWLRSGVTMAVGSRGSLLSVSRPSWRLVARTGRGTDSAPGSAIDSGAIVGAETLARRTAASETLLRKRTRKESEESSKK